MWSWAGRRNLLERGKVRTGSLFTDMGELGVVHPCRRHVIAVLHAVTLGLMAVTCLRPCHKHTAPAGVPRAVTSGPGASGTESEVAGSERAGVHRQALSWPWSVCLSPYLCRAGEWLCALRWQGAEDAGGSGSSEGTCRKWKPSLSLFSLISFSVAPWISVQQPFRDRG